MADFAAFKPGPVAGSYFFEDRETGKPLLMHGPEAERLKAKIEAQPDLRVAGDFAAGGVEDEEAQMSRQTMSEVPAEEPNASVSEGPTKPASTETRKAPVWVPWRSDKGGVTIEKAYDEKGNEVGIRERTAGSPGKSKKSLQQDVKNSVAMPSGMRETIEGGYDPDEQYLLQLDDSAQRRELAAEQQVRGVQEELAAKRRLNNEIATIKDIDAQEQLAKNAEIQKRVGNDQVSYDSAIEAVRGKKVNANRLFSGAGGKMRLIGLAIANGFNQYASTMTGTQNTTWNIINTAIDNDIAEQEHEIMQGNKNVDNALARLTRSTGSLEQGKLLLKQLQQEHAMAEAQDISDRSKSQEVAAKLEAFKADNLEDYETKRELYMRMAAGKHSAAVEAKFLRPTSGTRGGVRPLSLDRADKIVGTEGKSLDLRATEAGIHKTEAEANKANREAEGGGAPISAKDRGMMAAARQGMNNTLSQLGLAYDPESGNVAKTQKDADIPGVGLYDSQMAKIPGTKDSYARQTVGRQLIQQIFEASGLTVTEPEFERHEKSLFGDGTEQGFMNGLNNIVKEAKAKERAAFGGKPSGIPEVGADTKLPQPEPVN